MTVNSVEPLLLTWNQLAVLRFLRLVGEARTVEEIAFDAMVSLLAPAVRQALVVLAGYGLVEKKGETTWGIKA